MQVSKDTHSTHVQSKAKKLLELFQNQFQNQVDLLVEVHLSPVQILIVRDTTGDTVTLETVILGMGKLTEMLCSPIAALRSILLPRRRLLRCLG